MDILLICRDALENSVVSNLAVAMEAKKRGEEVAVLFTQEALAALSGQMLDWSPLFRDRDTRTKIAKAATRLGIPWADKDPRWTRPRQVLQAAHQSGVSLLACPLWSELLETKGKLPPEVKEIDLPTALQAMKGAKVIIGSF